MTNFETAVIILVALSAIMSLIALILVATGRKKTVEEINVSADKRMTDLERFQEAQNEGLRETLRTDIAGSQRDTVAHISTSFKNYGDLVSGNQEIQAKQQNERLAEINKTLSDYTLGSEQKLENIRNMMEAKLADIRTDNERQLNEMRRTVDEKLQKTLEEKMNQSFALVNERLEQVYKGLGEMQTLAVGVGDLKKVLSNVKTRGIVGEIQLGSILEEILAPDQYDTNVATKHGSRDVVEFAVRLPAKDDGFIYLPIDSKFPGDTYAALRDAYETGSKESVDAAAKQLINTIRREAKDIRDKYIDPPNTTDFAIMFLPFEGLYSEVVNRGMVELLQRDYKVNIAGPSTMAAFLNSIQMGFKTLAVQKRSAEVWKLLGSVKKEFETFNAVLLATQQRLDQANKELDKLVGVRTRMIAKKLSAVETDSTPIEAYFDDNSLIE